MSYHDDENQTVILRHKIKIPINIDISIIGFYRYIGNIDNKKIIQNLWKYFQNFEKKKKISKIHILELSS